MYVFRKFSYLLNWESMGIFEKFDEFEIPKIWFLLEKQKKT